MEKGGLWLASRLLEVMEDECRQTLAITSLKWGLKPEKLGFELGTSSCRDQYMTMSWQLKNDHDTKVVATSW